jgi:hypothetical protein
VDDPEILQEETLQNQTTDLNTQVTQQNKQDLSLKHTNNFYIVPEK